MKPRRKKSDPPPTSEPPIPAPEWLSDAKRDVMDLVGMVLRIRSAHARFLRCEPCNPFNTFELWDDFLERELLAGRDNAANAVMLIEKAVDIATDYRAERRHLLGVLKTAYEGVRALAA